MKKTNRVLSLGLVLMMLFTCSFGFATTAQAESKYKAGGFTYYYTVKDKKVKVARIVQKDTKKKTLTIPAKISDKKVTSVNIDDYMYDDNHCNNVTVINLPKYLEEIYGYSFPHNPTGLKAINIDKSNAKFKSVDGVLYSKDKKRLVKYPQSKKGESFTVPASVTTIDMEAFSYNTKLKKITINGAATLEDFCITSTNCTEVVLGKKVKSLTKYSMQYNFKLKKYTVSSKNKKYSSKDGVLFNKKKTELINYPCAKTAKEYTVPKTVKNIKDNAFYSCDKLQKVTLPANLETIGDSAFSYCTGLKSITIPSKVKKIKDYTFSGCLAMKTLIIKNKDLTISVNDAVPSEENYDENTGEQVFVYTVTIKAPKGSKAEKFAKKNGIAFKAL